MDLRWLFVLLPILIIPLIPILTGVMNMPTGFTGLKPRERAPDGRAHTIIASGKKDPTMFPGHVPAELRKRCIGTKMNHLRESG